MKATQYMRQEKAIAAADAGGIRERWLWGLRLLRDPDAFAPGSSQLRPGLADQLVAAAKALGFKLSAREIQWRLKAARTYKTDSQITNAGSQFGTWTELRNADFPAVESNSDEPAADHRTKGERDHDHARALIDLIGDQGSLFPLTDFEPTITTLKQLQDYADEQAALTARFAAHDEKRRAYLDALIEAADGDLDMTWQEAHDRLPGEDGVAELAESRAS